MSDEFIWHPYTQQKIAGPNISVSRASGAYLFDENNSAYLDAISSWWVNLHGHCHPTIVKAIAAQAAQLEQVIFAGFTHPKAMALAASLLQWLPHYGKVFFSDNGSTATEAAVKMALQFWANKNEPRHTLIAFREGYHGDTFGAMSVSARDVFTAPFQRLLFDVVFIDAPVAGKELQTLQQLDAALQQQPAAFIFEPLVLGSAGMLMYSAEVLETMIRRCRQHGVLTIADEVFTGFGRTGKMFATDHLSTRPDLLCLSKGITGGFLPMGVTLATHEVYEPFHHQEKYRMLFHGHSYTGNALACAAAVASLQVFEEESTLEKVTQISNWQQDAVATAQHFPHLKHARSCGTIFAVDYVLPGNDGYLHPMRDQLYRHFMAQKIVLRPLGNTVYIVPPYCITIDELHRVHEAIFNCHL
ncbi:MAG: adenosylmethionine--8-amino-7-oxononanoate transaminase [Chitinophagales bacterium]